MRAGKDIWVVENRRVVCQHSGEKCYVIFVVGAARRCGAGRVRGIVPELLRGWRDSILKDIIRGEDKGRCHCGTWGDG